MRGAVLPFRDGLSVTLLALLLAAPPPVSAQPRRPVYVGAKVCATCHDGPNMGHQTTLWLGSRHAQAYASLETPEARAIAAISGVPIEPQKSPLCLGCHATAVQAESWERDETFSTRDGVQCEKCHGAGSEHVDSWLAGNERKNEPKIRLTNPVGADCMKCHKEKPSHTRSLGQAHHGNDRQVTPFDLAQAMRALAHPTPRDWKFAVSDPPQPPTDPQATAKYTGSHACAECHDAPEKGYQFSRWRSTKHAQAYGSLGTPAARVIAAKMGIAGDPQTSTACLKCHATAYHRASAGVAETYSILEGVGCEACHGAGSAYAPEDVMKDRPRAIKSGLLTVDKSTCLACHEQAHGKPFDHDTAWKMIAHPAQAPARTEKVTYKTPLNLAIRPGGNELYVTCESSSTVCVIDIATRRKLAEIAVGGQPTDVTFSPDGSRAYVTNRLDDSLSVVNTAARRVVATVPVGDEPHGVRTDASGKTIYVLNASSDDISVLDAATLQERKRLAASRSPWALCAVARRQSPAGHQCALAVCPFPRARALRGHGHRPGAQRWSRTVSRYPRPTCCWESPGIPQADSPWPPCCVPRTWCQ